MGGAVAVGEAGDTLLGARFADGALGAILVVEALRTGVCGEITDAVGAILITQAIHAGVVVCAALLIVGAIGVLCALDALVGHWVTLLCARAFLAIDAADTKPTRGITDWFEWVIAAHVVDALNASTSDIALEAIGAVIVIETRFAEVVSVAFLAIGAIAIDQTLITDARVFIAYKILPAGDVILADGLADARVGLAGLTRIALDVFARVLLTIKGVRHAEACGITHDAAGVSLGAEVFVEAGRNTKALVGGRIGQAFAALSACGVVLTGEAKDGVEHNARLRLGIADFIFAHAVRGLLTHALWHIADVLGLICTQIIGHISVDDVWCGVFVGALFGRIDTGFGACGERKHREGEDEVYANRHMANLLEVWVIQLVIKADYVAVRNFLTPQRCHRPECHKCWMCCFGFVSTGFQGNLLAIFGSF